MRWIFFDVGSTLIDETEAYHQRVREMIAGTEITFQAFEQMSRQLAQKGLDGDSDAIRHFGLTKTPWPSEKEKPYPEAKTTLETLRQKGYRLGVIANQQPGLAKRLESWGLQPFFDVIASSAEIGYAKPSREIFEKALAMAGCTPQESVMVGDRLDNDIFPAQAIGMKTVWIRQGNACYQPPELGRTADWIIDRLGQLEELFEKRN